MYHVQAMSSDPYRRNCLVSYADPEELPPALREKVNILPFRRNILYTVARSRGLGPHLLGLVGGCFDGGQRSLPELDWQLVVLRVSKKLDCKYEWDVNLPVSEVHGMPREKIENIGCSIEDVLSGQGPWTEIGRAHV